MSQQISKPVTLVFKPEELNILLAGLAELPYRTVANLFGSIQNQLSTQVDPSPEVVEEVK